MSSSLHPSTKATKKSAFSCDPCRRRKVKCDGSMPICYRCVARKETCVFKLSPTLSYTQKLETRIKELEDLISKLGGVPPTAGIPASSPLSSPTSSQNPVAIREADIQGRLGSFEGLKFDGKGGITYHGATSFFQLPTPRAQDDSSNNTRASEGLDEGGQRKERLVNNAWQQRALETFSETPEPFQFLLDVHWCWIQPLFNFVYRPAFTRDMESLGPYYSHTLLTAMISHSVRWCRNDERICQLLVPFDSGDLFSRQARTLLFDELRLGHCTIPTVQTLLLLSAQECSNGNRTQAWLYSGMAFRLIEDMGICIDGQKYAGTVQLSDEDIEIRRRLFWSCYFWDKMISLYLGRSPTLQHSTVKPPRIMLDDSAENDLWTPHGIVYPQGVEYPPTEARSISCFMKMCQLVEIFNKILIHMYDPLGRNSEMEIQACLDSEGEALRLWREELPDFLMIDAKKPPMHCPPSHIVTLNCLYLTFKILLYRPILFQPSRIAGQQRPDPNHLAECITSATSIIAIFDLFCRTFGESYCILSLSYSVYTAASIFLLQIQASTSPDSQTIARLEFCVQALEKVKFFTPVICSSLVLITQALSKLGINLPARSTVHDPIPLGEPNSLLATKDATPNTIPLGNVPFELAGNFHAPQPSDFNPDGFEISSEMLDAFASLEPIEATVGTLHNFDGGTSLTGKFTDDWNMQ